jgi:glycosyltransferase involved in cell wall biosynthesis
MNFTIITPSFNQLDYLKRCVASVADQPAPEAQRSEIGGQRSSDPSSDFCPRTSVSGSPIHVHHHIQDAQSSDGTIEFLKKFDTEVRSQKSEVSADLRPPTSDVCSSYIFSYSSERDAGMYDAINRGWRMAIDEHSTSNILHFTTHNSHDAVVAWLNCDEQYLPRTLEKVATWFHAHPDKDVLFGEVVVADSSGGYICSRKMVMPSIGLIQTDHLPFFTAAMFIRKSALDRFSLYPDLAWKNIGDVELVLRMLRRNVQIGILHEYLSVFSESGGNFGLDESARQEYDKIRSSASLMIQKTRLLWIVLHRLRKWFAGGYHLSPFSYAIYTNDLYQRTDVSVEKPEARWVGRLKGKC